MVNLLELGLIWLIKGVESANDHWNFFGVKFDGQWSNNIKNDMSLINDALGELYEKYSVPGQAPAPELKLLIALSISCASTVSHLKSNNKQNINNELEKLQQEALADDLKAKQSAMSSKFQDDATKQLVELNKIKEQQLEDKKNQKLLSEQLNLTDTIKLNEQDIVTDNLTENLTDTDSDSTSSLNKPNNNLIPSHVSSVSSIASTNNSKLNFSIEKSKRKKP